MKIVMWFDLFKNKFDNIFLYKDVYQFPKKLKEILKGELELNFYSKKENKKSFEFESDVFYFENNLIKFIYKLYKNAKKIDVCIFFHIRLITFLFFVFYKIRNKNGKIILKGDITIDYLKNIYSNKYFFKGVFYRFLINKVNLFLVETKECYFYLKEKGLNNIEIYPNIFDLKLLENMQIRKKKYLEKENIILHVSRIGTYEKNTDLLLEILENIDLKDWRVYILGTIEEDFKIKISEFYSKNKILMDKIKFLGKITDKKEVYEFYNKSKIYISTSRYEGFSIAFTEALVFNNYIITSRVNCAKDIINDGEFGIICEKTSDFIKQINLIINEKKDISNLDEDRESYIKKLFSIEKIKKTIKGILDE